MKDVAVIGAGLAGLECARLLEEAELDVTLLEAADAPGGRVRTDVVDGFRLDRGFQVLLTSYPEAKRSLDYSALSLKAFRPGAMVWQGGRFHRFADPLREPVAALGSLFDPVVPMMDKIGIMRLRRDMARWKNMEYFEHPERTTRAFLRDFGFSDLAIERFFQPLFGGMFLEHELVTSSHFFEFLFRMLSSGSACVPSLGMEEIPRQLAATLSPGTLITGACVKTLKRSKGRFTVEVEGKAPVEARAIVLAVDERAARLLLSQGNGEGKLGAPREWNATTTFYYAAGQAPVDEPMLMLNGEGSAAGPVNHLAVMTAVSKSYAPSGTHLLAANVVGVAPDTDAEIAALEQEVRAHMTRWFGQQVGNWQIVGGYPIRYAVPRQQMARWEKADTSVQFGSGTDRGARIYLCGDYRETSSIQGSIASGRRVADALISALKKRTTSQ
ncbi:MAG TPA: NAD(P)/FAD-dependent oxidoreductase [Acidisarcina sp.]|nr:NAD(P)/FAD-dependent oxidoreductase [Acidisarcina sp.]